MSITGFLRGKGPSGFGWSSTAEEIVEDLDLSDRTILITGSNSGLGAETARVLAMKGAKVLATARTEEKAEAAVREMEGEAIPLICELGDPQSVRSCAGAVRDLEVELDAIICNAGIMALPKRETLFGYEKQFFVNHVGHFILVTELLDLLADDGRVIAVTSEAHKMAPADGIQFDDLSAEKHYGAWRAYGHSKLANVLFARELAYRFENSDTSRVANAAHPGPIDTNLTRNINVLARGIWSAFGPFFLKSIPEGAATQTWAAVHPDTAELNGEYLLDCNVARSSSNAADLEMAHRLWEVSEEIVAGL